MHAPDMQDYSNADLLDYDIHQEGSEPFYDWLMANEPLFWDKNNEIWAVSRYEDVVFVSKHPEIFCSKYGVVPKVELDTWPDEALINKDGKDHTISRALVSKGFTPRRVRVWEEKTRDIVTELIDSVIENGECDFVKDIARPLPMRVIGLMFNYPLAVQDKLLDLTDTYTKGGSGPAGITEDVVDAFQQFCMFHFEFMDERRDNPGDDLITAWLNAEIDGQRLSEDKILYEHNLLLVGGSETTRYSVSLGLLAALTDRHNWETMVAQPDIVANAAEEMVRWSTPFIRMRRTLTQDFEMHGKQMKAMDQIVMLYPAANRDPRVWDRPLEFDVKRDFTVPSLSFGWGKHYCLGANLARMEMRILLEEMVRRMPDIRLKEGSSAVHKRSAFLRGLDSMHITFTPGARVGVTPREEDASEAPSGCPFPHG